jgi:hypothetical protein
MHFFANFFYYRIEDLCDLGTSSIGSVALIFEVCIAFRIAPVSLIA